MTTTAVVRVVCRADRFEQTARLLAWAIGRHPIGYAEPGAVAITRSLFIDTGLAYDERAEIVPSDFALDMVALVPGVLSWSVVSSDELVTPQAPSSWTP